MDRYYERIEDGNLRRCPINDFDGSVTGRIVYNVPAYFDENPAEARRLGWTKHVTHGMAEIKRMVDYDPQTQRLVVTARRVDEWTVEDEYHVIDKSEEMLLMEELSSSGSYVGATTTVGGFTFFGGDLDE